MQVLCRLSYNSTPLVGLGGVEPPTSCLSGTHSNLMSYSPLYINIIGCGGRIWTCDLRVMSPMSCQTALLRHMLTVNTALYLPSYNRGIRTPHLIWGPQCALLNRGGDGSVFQKVGAQCHSSTSGGTTLGASASILAMRYFGSINNPSLLMAMRHIPLKISHYLIWSAPWCAVGNTHPRTPCDARVHTILTALFGLYAILYHNI